jgi:hypothetical protein
MPFATPYSVAIFLSGSSSSGNGRPYFFMNARWESAVSTLHPSSTIPACRLKSCVRHSADRLSAEIIDYAQWMSAVRSDKNVRTARILPPEPAERRIDLLALQPSPSNIRPS